MLHETAFYKLVVSLSINDVGVYKMPLLNTNQIGTSLSSYSWILYLVLYHIKLTFILHTMVFFYFTYLPVGYMISQIAIPIAMIILPKNQKFVNMFFLYG